MNLRQKLTHHYFALAGIILLGTLLRFWHLDLKPLWLDEVLTAFFSLGLEYNDLPLDVVFPLSTLQEFFTLEPEASCRDIAQTLAQESTHPPLFFCLMHSWLRFTGTEPLAWALRSFPALIGVSAIAAIYCLNRLIFSPMAGLIAAALMAVSPFAVYLSQEARHYTLPMLLIILALLALIPIQQRLYHQQLPSPWLWLGWGMVNSIGCYVHYFFLLAVIAQFLTLISGMIWYRRRLPGGSWSAVALVMAGMAVSYLPWWGMLLADMGRSETNWLPSPDSITPVLQLLVGWFLMVIALPVENQPLWIVIPMGGLTLGLGGWIIWRGGVGVKQLLQKPATELATLTLFGFTLAVLLQFLAIIYLLGKDISVVPRYNFVYYPTICALLAASLTVNHGASHGASGRRGVEEMGRGTIVLTLAISVVSTVCVVANLVFLKPYYPQQVAENMTIEPTVPLIMVMGYDDLQDIGLGLSFALALENLPEGGSQQGDRAIAFLSRQQGYDRVWQQLSELAIPSVSQLNLWVIAPGLKRRDYPQHLAIANQKTCILDPSQHYRIGIPYQLYRCGQDLA
jgi:uncharacterized membrane protein